jgi:peptide maturation system protein (TIGR04066 family)
MKRTPVAFYPYTPEFLPFVKYFNRLQNKYTLDRLVSPRGLGLVGKDAGYARNHDKIGMPVFECLGLGESSWEILFMTKPVDVEVVGIDEKLFEMAKKALGAGKKVAFFCEDPEQIPTALRILFNKYSGVVSLEFGGKGDVIGKVADTKAHFYNIDTPVILVGGITTNADQLDIILSLVHQLRTEGLDSLVITKHSICRLFGFHCIDNIMDNKSLTEAEKATEVNAFVKNLETAIVPNLIIVEAPDAVLKYSNRATNGFGLRSYIVCQSLPPDYFVCCLPYSFAIDEYIDKISADFSVRLGTEITAVHTSNEVIDSVDIVNRRKVWCVRVALDVVREHIKLHKHSSTIPIVDAIGNGISELYDVL